MFKIVYAYVGFSPIGSRTARSLRGARLSLRAELKDTIAYEGCTADPVTAAVLLARARKADVGQRIGVPMSRSVMEHWIEEASK